MQPSIMKSARLNGLIMGLLFSINFLLSISKITVLMVFSYFVMSLILVGIYRMAIRFRDVENAGVITFGRVYSFIVLTFFFAALISSAVKYIYFQFINPQYLETLLQESMKVMEALKFPFDKANMEQMQDIMKPATFSLQYIWMNVILGSIVGLVMAPFISKKAV